MCHILLGQTHRLASGVKDIQLHLHAHLSLFLVSSISWKKWLAPQLLHAPAFTKKSVSFWFVFSAQLLAASTREIRLNQNKMMNYHKTEAKFNWMADRIEQQEDKSCVLKNVLYFCFCLKNYIIVISPGVDVLSLMAQNLKSYLDSW